MTRSTSDIGLEVLASSGASGGWAMAAAGAAALGTARVMVMYHGTRNAGFKRFLGDRPTFFMPPERVADACQYAAHPDLGAAQESPCKQKRLDPALLEVAVDPGRIMDLSRPEDVAAFSEILGDLVEEGVLDPLGRYRGIIEEAARGALTSVRFRSYRTREDEKSRALTPALPFVLLARREFVQALAAHGYDSAWVKEYTAGDEPGKTSSDPYGYQSLAVLNARDRARILRQVSVRPGEAYRWE